MFHVSLRNQPVYDRETLEWLRQYEGMGLTGNQKRLLVFARAHQGQFTSRDFQKLVGLTIYEASNEIKTMIRKDLVRQLHKGGKIYRISDPSQPTPLSEEFTQVLKILDQQGYITNQDVRAALGLDRKGALRVIHRLVQTGMIIRAEERARRTRYVRIE
jgi:DNA-binding MarR family transcriptional regulator